MDAAHAAARLTARVESASPVNESIQNGTTSACTERRPVRRQTQRRLSSNDGTVPTAVAMTLATPAGIAVVLTSTPSTVRLVAVATSETVP